MTPRNSFLSLFAALVAITCLLNAQKALAVIAGPYTADANTMHLWHLDTPSIGSGTTSPNSPDAAGSLDLTKSTTGSVGQAAGAFGYSGDQSFDAFYGGGDHPHMVAFTNSATLFGGTGNGAWTVEGLIKLDTLASGVIVRSNSNEIRVYLDNPNNSGRNLLVDVGSDGVLSPNRNFAIPDPINTGEWYHWAITYSGTPSVAGNVEAFWTPLDNSYTAAQSLGTRDFGYAPIVDRFVLNSQSGGNIDGQYDEIRISNIVRADDDMMFNTGVVPEPSSFVLAGLGLVGLAAFGLRRRRQR